MPLLETPETTKPTNPATIPSITVLCIGFFMMQVAFVLLSPRRPALWLCTWCCRCLVVPLRYCFVFSIFPLLVRRIAPLVAPFTRHLILGSVLAFCQGECFCCLVLVGLLFWFWLCTRCCSCRMLSVCCLVLVGLLFWFWLRTRCCRCHTWSVVFSFGCHLVSSRRSTSSFQSLQPHVMFIINLGHRKPVN